MPWKNKELELTWEHFVSKLMPGQKETWTVVVNKRSSGVMENWSDAKQPKTNTPALQHSSTPERLAAELVATLYDESLDAFAPQNWPGALGVFRYDYSTAQSQFGNTAQYFQHSFGNWNQRYQGVQITYRHFPADLTQRIWNYGWFGRGGGIGGAQYRMRAGVMADGALEMNMPASAAAPMSPMAWRRLIRSSADGGKRRAVAPTMPLIGCDGKPPGKPKAGSTEGGVQVSRACGALRRAARRGGARRRGAAGRGRRR